MSQKKKRILLILILVMLASTITAFVDVIITSQSSGSAISVIRLEEKPDIYFVIENPDSFFLNAVANEGKPVFLGLFGKTNIDELATLHNTNDVSYLGDFFVVYSFSIDAFSFGPYLLQTAIMGWVLLLVYGLISKALKI